MFRRGEFVYFLDRFDQRVYFRVHAQIGTQVHYFDANGRLKTVHSKRVFMG